MTLRDQAQEEMNRRSPAQRAALRQAWKRVEERVITLATSGKAKAKVFEVHHAVERARTHFLIEIVKGFPADVVERHVMAAYDRYRPDHVQSQASDDV